MDPRDAIAGQEQEPTGDLGVSHGRVGLDNPAKRHCWQDWHVTELGKQVTELFLVPPLHKVLDLLFGTGSI